MELLGKNIIGYDLSGEGTNSHKAVNPAIGDYLEPSFYHATNRELENVLELAREAAYQLRQTTPKQRSEFLQAIAQEIEKLGDELTDRAHQETGLPRARLVSERGRTISQLNLFSKVAEEGCWVDARIDLPLPDREPLPRPDIRRMLIPIGPVAVFCASNFPLAFSVAGGDTAAALAAGNPVIVKAHHAHPGTAELVARAIQAASKKCDMPPGTFSLVHGPGSTTGKAIVTHPSIRAVGFTGSQGGGRKLHDLASSREIPIPVYAEMASINPVFLLPKAVEERGREIANGLQESVTLGVGQFCTNPGLIVMVEGAGADAFLGELGKLLKETPSAVMLHAGIRKAYGDGLRNLMDIEGVNAVVVPSDDADSGYCNAFASLFTVSAETFLKQETLKEEVFGPSTLVVICESPGAMLEVARTFDGELTSTIHGDETELKEYRELVDIMEARVGRLICSGFPTGVEVCHAMNHGGPYPATTDVHFTSVGATSIFRFARPICYQGWPNNLLPDELKNENPLGIWRTIDGEMTKEPVS